jgi:predicted metal-dependent phosphoesterase TrpH/glycosyltransferase involved in cell wall biosynthesis
VTERLSIAQVTPYPWEGPHAVVTHVDGLARELHSRGHRVLVVAPTRSSALVRDSRRSIRAARERPASLFGGGAEPRVLGVGEVLELPTSRRRAARLPIDVARTIEEALSVAPLDIVHVHEPFAPSTSSAALRHSRSLNVGTFHAPTERVLSTQLARRVVALLLGRLDARVASYEATRELMQRFFPASYRVIAPAVGDEAAPAARSADGPVEIVFLDEEERPALRLFLRALRRLPAELDWRATLVTARDVPPATAIQARVRRVDPDSAAAAQALAAAELSVNASSGAGPAPDALLRTLAAGAVPLASRIPVYEEILAEGGRGLLFETGDIDTFAAQLARLAADRALRERLRSAADPLRSTLTFARLADELEEVYSELASRRHGGGDPRVRARLRKRALVDVDLHMHTDHSPDCATPVEVLLAEAKAKGLGAIAITDHNEVSGAHEARAKADGIKVIVAEEVKTADQGEVIGLFIEDKIPRGMTLEETIAAIRAQGGVVYVPHPFDRLHAVPDYEHLLGVVDQIDALEVFNPRVAVSEFNEEAVRFAAKYRIPAGAGSDAHVAQGLGSVRIRMRNFDGPEEFLESLREADIIRKPASLLYVQALKFLQTKATPAPARPAVRARRVRRASRKS